jgi:hypothetical protein
MADPVPESGITRVLLVGLGVMAALGALSVVPISATLLGWAGPASAVQRLLIPLASRFGTASGAISFTQVVSFGLAVLLLTNGGAVERIVAVLVVLWLPASYWALGTLGKDPSGRLVLIGVVTALGCTAILAAAGLAVRLGLRGRRAEQARQDGRVQS